MKLIDRFLGFRAFSFPAFILWIDGEHFSLFLLVQIIEKVPAGVVKFYLSVVSAQ